MKKSLVPLDDSQKRGRTFFLCALVILGALLIQGSVTGAVGGDMRFPDSLFSVLIYGLVLVLAFRGGQLSMVLVKGCAGLFALLYLILALLMLGKLVCGRTAAKVPDFWISLQSLLMTAAVAFCVWALFFSRDVKGLIARQRLKGS